MNVGASQTAARPIPDPDLVDEFSELDRQVSLLKPVLDRHEALKKQIKAFYECHPADQTAVAQGKIWNLQVSAKSNERKWKSIPALYKLLKRDVFFRVCQISLKSVEEIVGEPATAELVTTDRTGSRRLTPVLRSPATA